jgi:hypothetical protein
MAPQGRRSERHPEVNGVTQSSKPKMKPKKAPVRAPEPAALGIAFPWPTRPVTSSMSARPRPLWAACRFGKRCSSRPSTARCASSYVVYDATTLPDEIILAPTLLRSGAARTSGSRSDRERRRTRRLGPTELDRRGLSRRRREHGVGVRRRGRPSRTPSPQRRPAVRRRSRRSRRDGRVQAQPGDTSSTTRAEEPRRRSTVDSPRSS